MKTGDILFVCRERDTVNISWGLIWTLVTYIFYLNLSWEKLTKSVNNRSYCTLIVHATCKSIISLNGTEDGFGQRSCLTVHKTQFALQVIYICTDAINSVYMHVPDREFSGGNVKTEERVLLLNLQDTKSFLLQYRR